MRRLQEYERSQRFKEDREGDRIKEQDQIEKHNRELKQIQPRNENRPNRKDEDKTIKRK